MWSALWFRGDTGPGEVDLVEAYSNKPDLANAWECVVITVHENTDGTGSKKSFVYRFPAGQYPYQVEHDYGMEFAADRLRFSIDGTVVFEPTVATYPWMAAELADTWNMRVNQQISAASTWFYAPDAGTVFPRDMDVDFVRVYDRFLIEGTADHFLLAPPQTFSTTLGTATDTGSTTAPTNWTNARALTVTIPEVTTVGQDATVEIAQRNMTGTTGLIVFQEGSNNPAWWDDGTGAQSTL
jgi:hypothetical protein